MNSRVIFRIPVFVFTLVTVISCNSSKENRQNATTKILKLNKDKDSIKKHPTLKNIDTLCVSDFKQFFDKFSRDTIFQKQRIVFPLKTLGYFSEHTDELETKLTSKIDFKVFDFSKDRDAMKREFNKYETVFEWKQDCISVYGLRGYDNGISVDFRFKKIDNKWFLFEIVDESS